MTSDMSGKTVVVTGAAGGVGDGGRAPVRRGRRDAGPRRPQRGRARGSLRPARRAHRGPRRHLRRQQRRRHREPHGRGGGRDRAHRRARQHRRPVGRGPDRGHVRGGLGPGRGREPQGHVLRLQPRHPGAQEDPGLHHQPELGRRARRDAGDGRLHGVQGRRERDDQGARHRAGAAPGPGQRRLPGRHHDADAAVPGRHLRRRRPRGLLQAPARQLLPGRQGALHHAGGGRGARSSSSPRRRRRRSPAPTSPSTSAPRPGYGYS